METNSNSPSRNSSRNSNNRSSCNTTKSQGATIGILLILFGMIFLSFNFGWINSALKWVIISWPMVFIVLSIISLAKRDYTQGLIMMVIGAFFLLPRLAGAFPEIFTGINPNFAHTFWPVLLIIIGLIIVLQIGSGRRGLAFGHKRNMSSTAVNSEGMVQKNVLFGGSESIFLDPVFNGGNISATFGGVVLDLRKTTLPEGDTYLDISAIFGGVQLYVPEGWLIDNRLQAILGGTEDRRRFNETNHSRRLILQGTLIFGGCEIS